MESNFVMDSKLYDRQQTLQQTANFVMDSKLCDGQQTLWWKANFVIDNVSILSPKGPD